MYSLFIDDIRFPKNASDIIARNSESALLIVKERGIPEVIHFDHDLGGEDTSILFINSLIDYMLDEGLTFPHNFKYYVHSANPVGEANIKSKMDAFLKFVKEN